MLITDFSTILGDKKNIVFIGEAGTGKTETSLSVSESLAKNGKTNVHLFDMDQTKPLFRARDISDAMDAAGVTVHYQPQLMDLPTLVPAVRETLLDDSSIVVMDIGGNDNGARMIGQFSNSINNENTQVYYLMNPYRPWTRDRQELLDAVARISLCSRVERVNLVCNPCLGHETTADEAVNGVQKLEALLGAPCDFVLAREDIAAEVAARVGSPVLSLKLYIDYD